MDINTADSERCVRFCLQSEDDLKCSVSWWKAEYFKYLFAGKVIFFFSHILPIGSNANKNAEKWHIKCVALFKMPTL